MNWYKFQPPLILIYWLIGSLLNPPISTAQTTATAYPDFKKPLSYPKLRAADVNWEKRVWKTIDVAHPQNKHFAFEEMPFVNLLLSFLKYHGQSIRVFLEDDFDNPLTFKDLQPILNVVDTIVVTDPISFKQSTQIVENQFDWTAVTHFKIKEDWVFDENMSQMHQRIIAIAPLKNSYDENGNYRGQQAMFWAYFDDLRPHLAQFTALYNWNNHLEYSWDDVFQLRLFNAAIAKDDNYYFEQKELLTQQNKQQNAQRIQAEVYQKEASLWTY